MQDAQSQECKREIIIEMRLIGTRATRLLHLERFMLVADEKYPDYLRS